MWQENATPKTDNYQQKISAENGKPRQFHHGMDWLKSRQAQHQGAA